MAECVKTYQFMFSVTLNVVKSLRSFALLRMTILIVFHTATFHTLCRSLCPRMFCSKLLFFTHSAVPYAPRMLCSELLLIKIIQFIPLIRGKGYPINFFMGWI